MSTVPPSGRNTPCPCGSGKRFKECHGSIGRGLSSSLQPGSDSPAPAPPGASEEPLARALALDRQLIRRALYLHGAHRWDLARKVLEQVLELDPRHADALHILGLLAFASGQNERALELVDGAIASYPKHAPFHVSRARIVLAMHRPLDASASLKRAADSSMERPDFWRVDGTSIVRAPAPIRRSIEGPPTKSAQHDFPTGASKMSFPDRILDRCNSLRRSGSLVDAENCIREALDEVERSPALLLELAKLLRDMVRHQEAVAVLAEVIAEQKPHLDVEATKLLAHSLTELGQTDEAVRIAREAYASQPESLAIALPALLTLKPVYEDLADLAYVRQSYTAGIEQLLASTEMYSGLSTEATLRSLTWSNFYLAYHGQDDRLLQEAYSRFVGARLDHAVPELRQPLQPHAFERRRVRIGFASHYFYDCSAGRYFIKWITGLSKDRFETFVYNVRPSQDALTARIVNSADHYVHAAEGQFLGHRIRDDALDVLVYPELGGNGATFLLAALRLAPLQCCGWGHPVTTGHSTIDYFFSSELAEPPNGQDHYSEQLVRLPGLGVDYDPPTIDSFERPAAARDALGLPTNRRLYLFPQSIYKIHPDNDALLARVLAQDPGAQLVLFSGHTLKTTDQFLRRLDRALRRVNVNMFDRVVVLPFVSRKTYMRINAACDVMLDSLHWSGGNTSLDAIASGLPVVTLPGAFMRGRQTLAMHRALNLPELVAGDSTAYTDLAIEVATNTVLRETLRHKMTQRRHRVFSDTRTIAAMEAFYEQTLGITARA